jgi:hypothetical protein
MKTSSQTWKKLEKDTALELGGVRVGLLGKEDVVHPNFVIECKLRAKISFIEWFDQAKKHLTKKANKGKMALLVVRQKNSPRKFVIMEMEDFKELTGVGQNAV